MSSFSREDGVIRHRSGALRFAIATFATLGSVPAMLGPILFGRHSDTLTRISVPITYLALLALAAALYHYVWLQRSARLRADRTGLWIDGRCTVRRADVLQAYSVENEHGVFLRLVRRGPIHRALDVAVADEAEAEQLLAALHLDSAHTVADYETTDGTKMSMWKRIAFVLLSFAGTLALNSAIVLRHAAQNGSHWITFILTTMLVGVACFVGLAAASPNSLRISVGADGVRIHRRRFVGTKTTFHPYASIAGASTDGHDTQLRLVDGTVINMHQGAGGKSIADQDLEARQLVRRIEQQLAVARTAPETSAAAVARNGRTTEEWLRDAAALRESQATFRKPVIPDDQLWSIVEDPTATASERAGAALALRMGLDAEDRDRLRIAAEACAAPRLRVALETVASEADEADLAAALAPLADQAEGRTMPMRTMSK